MLKCARSLLAPTLGATEPDLFGIRGRAGEKGTERATRNGLGENDPSHDHRAPAPAEPTKSIAREGEPKDRREHRLEREDNSRPRRAQPLLRPALNEKSERVPE